MSGRASRPPPPGACGQATVEWVALVTLALLIVLALLAIAGTRLPGLPLARALVERMLCAVDLSNACLTEPELTAEYGAELAGLVREHAPDIVYEEGMRALPVDFRACRAVECAGGAARGVIATAGGGDPVASFVHVVDCREGAADRTAADGYDCSGRRAGNLYLQYWFYYPDSATARGVPVIGERGYHRDDWESYAVRVGPDGTFARASSHHGYNYEYGAGNWGSDAGVGPVRDAAEAVGLRFEGGWGPSTGTLYVSGGSHAGNARRDGYQATRTTPGSRVELIPIEPVAKENANARFEVIAPWRKPVYRDPESEAT